MKPNNNNLILLVDDNPQNLHFLGELLSNHGYEIGIANNGAKALQFLETKMPDLILLDVMMPELNGFDVCRKIKQNIRWKHIPIIFLTAKAEREDIIEGFEVGAVDYVTKPFIPEELLARIKTHLEIKTLRAFLPICAKCKSVREKEGLWTQIEKYLSDHSDIQLSHSLCEECAKELYGEDFLE